MIMSSQSITTRYFHYVVTVLQFRDFILGTDINDERSLSTTLNIVKKKKFYTQKAEVEEKLQHYHLCKCI